MNNHKLKETIDQQRESIYTYIQRIAQLEIELARAKEAESEWYHFSQASEIRAQFYAKKLRTIRFLLALNTVEQNTHRTRNELLRGIVGDIARWLNRSVSSMETDESSDIPY